MDFATRMKRYFRATKLFLYYCSPCLLSLAVVIVANFRRVNDVDKIIVRQVCQRLNPPSASSGAAPREMPVQIEKLINVVTSNGWTDCLQNTSVLAGNLSAPQYIHSYFLTAWSANSVVISTLTLLPFGILGLGLALKYFRKIPLPSEKADNEKDRYLRYRKIALRDFILKCLVGFVIAVGWLYIFNPHGQAASAINDLLTNTDIVSNDTVPNFFNFKDSSLKHALTAVFGWYLYLLGYFFYRFYKSDVLGTRLYNVLFKKFLFVIGIAFIISSVGATSNESLLLIFLIGFFPLSAVTLMTEFANKRLSMGEDQTSLSILPGMSTWQILRLEEEGIDSLSSLASADPLSLSKVISKEVISPEMLETWIDQAQLITVIGTKRWIELNGICERASEFVERERNVKDAMFIAKLAEKNVFNAGEISRSLQKNFFVLRPQTESE